MVKTSWWQKITCSSTARLTPMSSGIWMSMSVHLWLRELRFPCASVVVNTYRDRCQWKAGLTRSQTCPRRHKQVCYSGFYSESATGWATG